MRPGIPTLYAGVRFRSRLEARWAAFFDLLGWRWEYEPLDLKGYIPDFVVTNCARTPVLFEVKPDLGWEGKVQNFEKIERSGWRGYAVVVGPQIGADDSTWGHTFIGPMKLILQDVPLATESVGGLLFRCEGRITLGSRGSLCLYCGCIGTRGWEPGCRFGDFIQEQLFFHQEHMAFWREAGNEVQWRRPR